MDQARQAPLKLVMFDLDGTLIETGVEITNAVNDTLTELGHVPVSLTQVTGWIGAGATELLITALAHSTGTGHDQVRVSEQLAPAKKLLEQHYSRRSGTGSSLYPKVREVLTALRKQGVKLAIVTNKDMRYTEIVLEAHALTDMVDLVIGGDTMPAKKPDPAGILHCLQHFGVAPDQALFVGDSSIDAATARNAGVPVWLLPYGYNMNQDVRNCAPDRVIDDISALLEDSSNQ